MQDSGRIARLPPLKQPAIGQTVVFAEFGIAAR
jgi:hypothetical protein